MSSNKEGLSRVLTVAFALCIVCSVVVSAAAVVLKPAQEVNKTRDLKRNILMAAGLYDPSLSVEEQFELVTTRVVDIDSGTYVDGIDPDSFERETLKELGMPEEIVMRHRSPHFGHIFSGEGYSSGYYGYMWADVLTSDASEAFAEAPGGFYDKDVAAKLVKYLFEPRNAMDPAEAYRAFRGRDADIAPLMRDRGFPVPE